MGYSRHRAERGFVPAGHHVHVENGRGRGALTSVLVVPEAPIGALAGALETLYGSAGPANLDERLGRLAAQAPAGTTFLVGLADQAWVYPSAMFVVRHRAAGREDLLTEPQVVTFHADDRIEVVEVASGALVAALAGESSGEVPVHLPEPPDADADAAATEAYPARAASRARIVVPTAILGLLGVALAVGLWKGGGGAAQARRDAHVAPPAVGGPASSTELRADERFADPPAPVETPGRAWLFRAPAAISSSPLVVGNRVIFGCRDSILYCLDARRGDVVWETGVGSGIGSSPREEAGVCFVGTYDGELVAADLASGALRWRSATGGKIVSSPCIVGDRVIVGSYDRSIHAFDRSSGQRRWSFATGAAVRASPEAIGEDAVAVGSSDGTLYCLDARDGKVRWRLRLGSPVLGAAAFDPPSGSLVVGAQDGTAVGLDAFTGAVRWRRSLQGEINAQPRFAGAVVLLGTGRGRLHALDPTTGRTRWLASAARGFDARPAVVEETVVAPSFDGVVHFLALADGTPRGERALGAEIYASPAAGPDLLYLGTLGGALHALPLP